ncbi:MAG: carboxypeptidase-like regulatory domain-containing protein [Saprospiraceae bacterium]|nr:carboxypeptidase-like regulatory domain-containing protein [Saprospiraceae bacterium]
MRKLLKLLTLFFALSYAQFAQAQYKIKGQVIDSETNEPAIFANVMVKNTAMGAQTDTAGYYELTLSTLPDSLIVSFVGYNRMAKAVNKTKVEQEINFSLRPETQNLMKSRFWRAKIRLGQFCEK